MEIKHNRSNTINFRDCGGFVTTSGKRVRRGMLYRSGSLDRLRGKNRGMVLKAGLKKIIDLRPEDERRKKRTVIPGAERVTISFGNERIARQRIQPLMSGKNNTREIITAITTVYYDMITMAPGKLDRIFRHLSDPSSYPLVINCLAGKDRTGFAIATILSTLGVPFDDVMRDYLATNDSLLPKVKMITLPLRLLSFGLLPTGNWESALTAHRSSLEAAFGRIKREYGGVDGYLDSCGVTESQRRLLRHILLEDASFTAGS